ncbi:MAG TPA: ATP-binding protein, partial [Gemmatimonadaceae bacterium]|nr:ATP-binding protein [Gemmatimonadaceae bacterium]
EPYVRLTRDTESAAGGSGIGLSIVQELVRLHRGSVRVEEAPGGGARFVIEFPRETAGVDTRADVSVPQSAGVGA